MKVKKIILRYCLPALAALFAGALPFSWRQSVIVNAPVYDVASLLNNIRNWKFWHPDFIADGIAYRKAASDDKQQEAILPGNKKYVINAVNPAAISVYKTEGSKTVAASLTVAPFGNGSSTYVEWRQKITGYTWLGKKLFHQDNIKKSLDSLKAFMEVDSRRYGYSIQLIPVIDTLIATTKITIPGAEVKNSIPVVLTRLRNYITLSDIPAARDYYYVSVVYPGNKEATLAVGIPVSKTVTGTPDVEFLKLPANGRLLAGSYKGLYADKQKLYAAMDSYISDKRLKKVAQPLEQYKMTDTAFARNPYITMTLFYPIF